MRCPSRRFLPAFLLVFSASFQSVSADFVGLDRNGDLLCHADDMGLAEAVVGDTIVFDLFFRDFEDPHYLACAFCVQNKDLVTDPQFEFHIQNDWIPSMFYDTGVSGPGDGFPSDPIIEAYPNARCWLAAAFARAPDGQAMPMPVRFGTFRIRVSEEGCVGFVLDGRNCWWQRWSGGSGTFADPGETCPPFSCGGPSSTERVDWGRLKTLFR
ncbi:MAG: hypothetical protein JW958_12285 [Candidatus Eisenbacteria bacterium]|nr:hypothetical protein [Candidatus Eisenbacteria bacterium]